MNNKLVYISCADTDLMLAESINEVLNKFHIDAFVSCQAKSTMEKMMMIEKMSVLVLLFSKETLASSIIDNEVTEAINRQLPIVPYQVDDTSIKENLSLDFMLKKSQWVLGYPDRQKQMDDLIVSVCRYLGVDAIQQNPTDPFEQLKRGIALEYGTNGLQKDRKQAMLWLKKSSDQGNYMAMFELYKLYRNTEDDNSLIDYDQAREWLIKAADAGLAEAQYILGTNYEVYDEHVYVLVSNLSNAISYPLKITKDLEKAQLYYTLSAKQGNKKAMYRLGMLYKTKDSSMENQMKAFKLLSASKEIDDPLLWLNLGYLYKEGIDGQENVQKCTLCFKNARHLGEFELAETNYNTGENIKQVYDVVFQEKRDLDPRINLLRARFYLDGNIVAKDKSKASEYILKASKIYLDRYSRYFDKGMAEQTLKEAASYGNIEACYRMGRLLFNRESYSAAMLYFNQAATAQLPIAKFYLGLMYLHGLGTIINKQMAFSWLKQADIPGLAYGTVLLGDLYLQGEVVKQDTNKALECYNRASIQNEPLGNLRLSQAYKNGWGVQIDSQKAEYWYKKAIENGLEE